MNVYITFTTHDVQLCAWGKYYLASSGELSQAILNIWTEKFHLSKQKFVMRVFNFARSVSALCAGKHLRTHTLCLLA